MVIGRETGDVILGDKETSALHAELEFTSGRVIVRDLGSRNGTLRDGKRLPQFALFAGQTFRCGTTEIALLAIEGANAPTAGGTAAGSERIDDVVGESSTTMDGRHLSSDAQPQSAAPTLPATSKAINQTIIGAAPPPGRPGTPPSPGSDPNAPAPTANAPEVVSITMPPVPELGEPAPVVAASESMPAMPAGTTQTAGAQAVLAPTSAAEAASRGPVANAVIKPGEIDLGPKRRKSARTGPGLTTIAKWAGFGLLGIAAIGGIAFLVYTLVLGRNQAFFHKTAAELPQDAIGVVAFRSPEAMLGLVSGEVPSELVELAKEDLGFDPFDPTVYESMGVDVAAPMAIGLLSAEGTVSVSIGVTDRKLLKDSLSAKAKETLKLEDELRWIEREYEGMAGLWLDEPIPLAVLWPDDRAIFISGGSADDVKRLATDVAKAPSGDNLSTRPGFKGIEKQRGKALAGMYIDGASARAAAQGPGLQPGLMALGDIDGLALTLVDDGPRIELILQTIIREGAPMLEMVEGSKRNPAALATIPTPVLAEFDAQINAESIYRSLSTTALGLGLRQFEDEFKEETGLDLRADILENMAGAYGMALLNLPTESSSGDWGALGWVALTDEDAAKKSAERFFAANQSKLKLEQTKGVTVYVDDGFFRVAFFVHAGHLWVAAGKVDIEAMVEGPAKSLVSDPRVPEIAAALAKGGIASGFFDVRQFLFAARPLMNEREREEEKNLSPVLSPMEVVTFRTEVKKRAVITRLTLHTSWDKALPGVAQALMEAAGKELAENIERSRRLDKCSTLIDHLMGLMRTELGEDAVSDIEYETRSEMLEECLSDETTVAEIECMQKAESLDRLAECEQVGQDATPVAIDEPDPTAVPFVDDIWPNTKPTGSGNGAPDPAVNYAVALGAEPQVRGPANALVTIVVFGDFQCKYCKRSLGTLDEVMAKHGKNVRLVFRHNPLPIHSEARAAAKAALAAAKQDKFWPMHDKLYDNQEALTESNFSSWALELGLDVARFDRDYSDRYAETQIDDDAADAKKLGAKTTPSFFVNGRFLAGAQPLHAFDTLINEELARAEKFVERRGNTRKGLYEDMMGRFAGEVTKPPATPIATPKSGSRYTIDTVGLPRRGTTGVARVEIVECGDFDCPFCKRANPTMDRIIKEYSSNVALFWLHKPLSFHPGAEPAARAAVAAANQGKFWEMHEKLFADKSLRSQSDFESMATALGLDVPRFSADLTATATSELVTKQEKLCADNDAKGTPSFFINGRLVNGAQSFDRFKEVIDEELAGGI